MPENTVMQSAPPEWSALATLLADVRRPGDYVASGRIETPMPSLHVDGVGRISFPVPAVQARALIEHAERAPYGRGAATVHDERVRRVWQVTPNRIQLTGKAWAASLAGIVSQVAEGLGCQGIAVGAELYKLLIYETGDFFVAHRDQADDQDFEIGEVFDHHRYLGPWRDRDDQPVEFGRIALEDDELLPADALADEEPDDVHFSEATGNEGARFERTWLRAALVLWPHSRFDAVCLSAGTEAALARLHILLGGADRSTHPHPHEVAAAIRLIGAIAERWCPDAPAEGIHLAQLLGHAWATADAALIEHLFSGLLLARYDGLQNAAINSCAQHLERTRRRPLLSALFEHHAAARPAACLALWLLLARANAADPVLIDALAARLVARLAECQPDRRLPHYRFEMHTNEDGPVGDIDDDDTDLVAPANHREQPPAPTMTADLVAEFVITLGQCGLAAQQAQAVDGMTANPHVFAAESILLPALERIAGNTPTASAALWRYCSGHFLARSETAPQPPPDWARAADLAGHCADCQELQDFARNNQAPSHRFRLREDRRRHLETQIHSHQLDIATRTERQGSPHTLICTKTRASYERAAHQYQQDRNDMARLLAVTERIDVPGADLCERLRTALAAGG
ncbi:MAG: hypothetical protein Q8L45_07730 [Xanthomonadaceae bacterium]|nr:hypothetical protein [Xanthomonadaceae bacterium]MDP2183940.1 hypothetical protein [Xanthomonadales bacterium]MDZ4116507.1 hypothetical protein [Xanthomonadaceae bacterium]MDZ4378727.1 hypothetical protein [Xanthomonadaceae bacterium]